MLRHERLSLVPTLGHRSDRVLSTLTSTKAPSFPSPCQQSTTRRLKRGWMRRPTRWPDDMRTLPRRASATQETRSTLKRANAHLDGTATPSWHLKASSDRRFGRSSSAERRRLNDWNARPDRRGNSGRRWGTTYRSRVGRTSEADAYSPSLGRGPVGGGADDFRVVPRGISRAGSEVPLYYGAGNPLSSRISFFEISLSQYTTLHHPRNRHY